MLSQKEWSILEALEEGRLILAGAEHKWQMNIIQTQKIIYKFKMSPYYFSVATIYDTSLVVQELATGFLTDTWHFPNWDSSLHTF